MINTTDEVRAKKFTDEMVDCFRRLIEQQLKSLGPLTPLRAQTAKMGLVTSHIETAKVEIPHGDATEALRARKQAGEIMLKMMHDLTH